MAKLTEQDLYLLIGKFYAELALAQQEVNRLAVLVDSLTPAPAYTDVEPIVEE